jgi:hypothetical protein
MKTTQSETSQGKVTWDGFKKELMELPKEDIVDLVDAWVKPIGPCKTMDDLHRARFWIRHRRPSGW